MTQSIIPEPTLGRPPSLVITPASYEAMGGGIRGIGVVGAPASAVWPTANMSLGYPFSLSRPITAKVLWACNGGTASGNMDLGIYDEAGNLIVSKGSTAQTGTSGASASQRLDITDTPFGVGRYYMFMVMDNGTGTTQRLAPSNAGRLAALGMVQVASNFPLAGPVTFAVITTAYLPAFGLSRLTTF